MLCPFTGIGKETRLMHVGLIDKTSLEYFRSLLLPQVVTAVEQELPITVLGLMKGDVACGAAAAWLDSQDTLVIRSLYVAPDYRRQGGGRLLVNSLAALGANLCDCIQCGYNQTLPEHDTLEPFLTALGFTPEELASGVYLTTLAELEASPLFRNRAGAPKGPVPFEKVSTSALTAAYKKAAVSGENYLDVPLTDPSVEQRVSMAMLEQGALRSFAAFTTQGPDLVTLAWVKSGQSSDLPLLLQAAFVRLREHYPPETRLAIQAVDDQAAQLIAAILPGISPVSRSFVRPVEVEEGGSL